jgi:hypothetical protein
MSIRTICLARARVCVCVCVCVCPHSTHPVLMTRVCTACRLWLSLYDILQLNAHMSRNQCRLFGINCIICDMGE